MEIQLASAQERLSLLQAVAGTVIGFESVESALNRLADEVCRVLRVDYCVIRRLKENKLALLACSGISRDTLPHEIDPDLGIGKILLEERRPIGLRDALAYIDKTPGTERPKGLEFISYAGTPMIHRDEVVGIMGVFMTSEQRDFTDEELSLLQALGNNISIAVRNNELFEELQAINSDLDARVQARTAELEAANRDLEAFTYTVAHDLRTPLRSIISNSQILMEDFGDRLPLEAKPLLERQAVSAKRLANMMDGLLALTRIGKQQIQIAQMSLSRLAHDVAQECMRANRENPPDFRIASDILIAGDPRMIRILLQNLFENSIKFAKPDARPVIRIRAGDSSDISFIVEDEGIGFDMEYAAKVFLPFERLVREDQYPGTGIGLASVKRIVDKHRGAVQVKSSPGEGTAFEFRF